MKALGLFLVLSWTQFAHAQISMEALQLLDEGYVGISHLQQEKPFNFYESCERMPAAVIGVDPVTRRERPVGVTILRPREGAKNKSVLIIPPSGGANSIDFNYAEQFCSKGIEAWVIVSWDKGIPDYQYGLDLRSHDQIARRTLAAVRQVVQNMRGRIGIMGTSAGAMAASVALAVEPRLRTGVFIAGGTGMSEILLRSDSHEIAKLRRERMRLHGWTREQYKAELDRNVLLDVSQFADGLRTKRVGMILARQDTTVPYRNQVELQKISNATVIKTVDNNHVWTIVSTSLTISYLVVDFFDRNL